MTDKTGSYKGYISRSAQKKFTITAGILGASFLIFQFIYPFIHMFLFMPGMVAGYKMTSYSIRDVLIYQDRIIYMSRTISLPGDEVEGSDIGTAKIYSTDLNRKAQPELIAELEEEEVYPVSNGDSLWFVTPFNLYEKTPTGIQSIKLKPVLSNVEDVFLMNDYPAVIEDHPNGLRLKSLRDPGNVISLEFLFVDLHFFNKLRNLPTDSGVEFDQLIKRYQDVDPVVISKIQAIEINRELHFFLIVEGDLYYGRRDSAVPDSSVYITQKIEGSVTRYFVIEQDGIPNVYYSTNLKSDSDKAIYGIKVFSDYTTLETEKISIPMMIDDYRIISHPADNSLLLVHQTMPFNVMISRVDNGELEKIKKVGSKFFPFFAGGPMLLMFVPQLLMLVLPILLAIILSILMSRFKLIRFKTDSGMVQYASLLQRGLAQAVDALFLLGPIITGYILIFTTIFNMGKFPVAGLLSIIFGFIWVIMGFLLLSYWEGKYGRTPGKLIMRIKVIGTDLNPIGFGRGILRNILRIVDGFFNFMVGIMIIALNKNWQRVGDMVAKSIVIKASSLQPPPASE